MIDTRSYNQTSCGDGLFGPSVWTEGCRGGFDFTIAFEESILAVLPAALFLVLAGPRSLFLLQISDKTRRRAIYTPKLITSCILVALQIASLVLVASSNRHNTKFSIAAATLNLLASCCIVLLSHIEHVKTIRPSFLLTVYLFTSLIFDAARLRSEWIRSVNVAFAAVLSTSTVVKLSLLILENVEKRRLLLNYSGKQSKESTSGPFNRGFFVWLNSLLISGWATVLTNNDLPSIYEKLSSERLAKIFGNKWDKATRDGRKPSLFLTTFKLLKFEIISIALPRLAIVGLSLSQPFLVSNALRFLSMPKSETTSNLGYGLIAAFALVFFGSAILTAWYEHLTFRAGAIIRGGLIGLIYRKMLRLPTSELNESSAVALMGNDIETLAEKVNALLVESWANTLTVGIAMWMLYLQLGAVCVAPIVMGIISLLLCGGIGKALVSRLTVYQKATQDRINFTSEALRSFKAVKMLGYTEKFTELIEKKRDQDLAVGKRFRVMIVWNNTVSNGNNSLTQAATFGAYAIAAKATGSETFSASQAITALSILNVMMGPLSFLLGNIPQSFAAFGCFKRIQEFLFLDERVDVRDIGPRSEAVASKASSSDDRTVRDSIEMSEIVQESAGNARISILDGSFSWGKDASVLNNITTKLPQGQRGSLTMLIGPIGSGKSSFLKAILGEIVHSKGVVSMSTSSVAYCDQTPWVMNATIRDNIIAESLCSDDSWFDRVIEACDLTQDLSRLPAGDLTFVGDKGVKLSGGQKQRLAIARAVYSRKPVAIFDDVFSGLDKATEQAVFTQVFGRDGLLRRNGTTVVLATHAVHRLPDSDMIIALGQQGEIIEQGTFAKLRTAGKYVEALDISEPELDEGEIVSPSELRVFEEAQRVESRVKQTEQEDTTPQLASDRSIFRYYFSALQPMSLAIASFYIILQAFSSTFRSVWLTWWGDGRGRSSSDIGYWFSIFTVLAATEAIFISLAIMHFLLIIGPASGKKLHGVVLKAVMEAPMTIISNMEPGSIINRFSQDMRLVDIDLPVALVIFLFEVAQCFGIAGLAVAAVSWFAIAVPFVIIVLIMIQRFYVRTSKQLRLLEIEHKAPLYSHFLESIHGLATIRAFGWTQQYIHKNLALLDNAQKPSYLLNCIQRWLTLALDLVIAVLTILLVTFAVVLKNKISASLLGIALVNMMNLGINLKGIIISWSTLETSLGAVTRIKDFSESTPSELLLGENKFPISEWPSQGILRIKNLAIRYDAKSEPILRDISLDIRHGEKLGLCGRSGSGKSSLIQGLLRMAEVAEGQILLDGEDITQIPKSLVRQKLSCFTQDPFLVTNSVRFNADPLSEQTDKAIISALERVGIWDIIKAKSEGGNDPLDMKMDENSLSHGQRQLFCLGRALLKRSTILILDEPTSSVDSQTDAMIQNVIRSEFKDRTIIMIAHRLDTLLDFDKIAVLERGNLVEYGTPENLLAKVDGAFSRLYRADKTTRRGSGP